MHIKFNPDQALLDGAKLDERHPNAQHVNILGNGSSVHVTLPEKGRVCFSDKTAIVSEIEGEAVIYIDYSSIAGITNVEDLTGLYTAQYGQADGSIKALVDAFNIARDTGMLLVS